MSNNLQNTNKNPIPPLKRYLSKDEFQNYLSLVKAIAVFNPTDKKWYLNEYKISRIKSDELKEIVKELSEYVGDEIYEILADYLKDNNNAIHAEFHGNYIIVYDDLEKYKDLLTYKIKTFDHISGKYIESEVLLAWQNARGFSTLRGLYWKLNNLVNFRIKPFANLQFYDINLKSFEMRDYQISSIKNWISDINTVGAGIIKAPTGSGKSVIAILAVLEMLKNKPNSKIIYAVNSTTLLKQFQNFARKEDLPFLLVSGEIDELQKGQKSDFIALSIAYYYSKKKRNEHGKLKELVSDANLIIIDEAHHTPATTIKSLLLDSPNSLRLGLSATPLREDGKELEITGLLGKISYSIEYQELVQKHYLVPLEYIQFTPRISKKIYDKLKNIEQAYSDQPFSKLYSAVLRTFEQSPYTNQQIIQKIKELNKFPALVIVRRISIAKYLSELLNQEGITSDWVSSKTSLEERVSKIENLKNGKLKILVATSLADEGLDIPQLSLVVLASQGKSRVKLIQRIGRVMRPYSGKSRGYVLDIAYNYDIFQRQASKRIKFVSSEYNGIISIKQI
jgi:DNA or RNA helicases of superfamily II